MLSEGVASLYITCSGKELFLKIEKIFKEKGLNLTDPNDGFVKMLDKNYDIEDVSRDYLLANLPLSNQVSFQWWWGENEDLYCRIRKVGQLSIIEFGIEHTSKEQTLIILETFIEMLKHYRDSFVGFVVDRSGYLNTNNYDIDEVILQRTTDILNLKCLLEIKLKDTVNLFSDVQLIDEHVIDSLILGIQSEVGAILVFLG